MIGRVALGLLAVGALVAAAVWWVDARVPAPWVDEGTHEAPAAAASAVDEVADAQVEVADGQRERVSSQEEAARSLTVVVDAGAYRMPADLQVALLFDGAFGQQVQRLRVGRDGRATWTSGAPDVWPKIVDFAFPTLGNSAVSVDEASEVVLTLPPTCLLEVEVQDVDGVRTDDAREARVSMRGASYPARRRFEIGLHEGRAQLLAEAGGQQIDFSVRSASNRSVQKSFTLPRVAGERVPCTMRLPDAGGVAFQLRGLESREPPWRVDLFCFEGAHHVRAPVAARGHLAFVHAGKPGGGASVAGWFLDEGAFVLAARLRERRWGTVRGRVAEMRPCVDVARGRVVDRDGAGVEGVALELRAVPSGGYLGERLHELRTASDGSFVLMGPDPAVVSMALVVGSTGERIDLPHAGPLLLRSSP